MGPWWCAFFSFIFSYARNVRFLILPPYFPFTKPQETLKEYYFLWSSIQSFCPFFIFLRGQFFIFNSFFILLNNSWHYSHLPRFSKNNQPGNISQMFRVGAGCCWTKRSCEHLSIFFMMMYLLLFIFLPLFTFSPSFRDNSFEKERERWFSPPRGDHHLISSFIESSENEKLLSLSLSLYEKDESLENDGEGIFHVFLFQSMNNLVSFLHLYHPFQLLSLSFHFQSLSVIWLITRERVIFSLSRHH